jgi:putative ABC transport system ATP-binding protein
MSTAPVVEARGVVKALGEGAGRVMAVNGVDFSLWACELTLLMGPSGSGKTTLLSMLGCVLTPTEGSIHVAGQATERLDPEALARIRRAHIGFVFQSYHLFPTLTAEENVKLVLDVRGQYKAVDRQAQEALAAVGIAHKARSLPRDLSGGEQQRVAIARALVGSPSVVLADEPTSALDGENGHAVMAVLSAIAKDQQRAVMAVTHDPRTVPFADRIVRIEDGKIVGEERGPASPGAAAPSTSSASHQEIRPAS